MTLSNLEDHLGYWLRYVSNHVSHAFAQKVERHGVTVAEWVLLRVIWQTGATNPSMLADTVGMTRGAISKLIERLTQKQLILRIASESDRRSYTVELLEAGRQLVPILAQLADENDREFFGHLPAESQAEILAALQEIVRRQGWKDLPME